VIDHFEIFASRFREAKVQYVKSKDYYYAERGVDFDLPKLKYQEKKWKYMVSGESNSGE
jgi:hypothetical protein